MDELLRRRARFDLVTLARPSAANKLLLRELEQQPGVRIVWGDLTCYEDVLACVTGADIVLHPAAMIAPAAAAAARLAIRPSQNEPVMAATAAQAKAPTI